jgi:hypothetical protein
MDNELYCENCALNAIRMERTVFCTSCHSKIYNKDLNVEVPEGTIVFNVLKANKSFINGRYIPPEEVYCPTCAKQLEKHKKDARWNTIENLILTHLDHYKLRSDFLSQKGGDNLGK